METLAPIVENPAFQTHWNWKPEYDALKAALAEPVSESFPIAEWFARIRAWQRDDTLGYDTAIKLLCELEDEMRQLLGAPHVGFDRCRSN